MTTNKICGNCGIKESIHYPQTETYNVEKPCKKFTKSAESGDSKSTRDFQSKKPSPNHSPQGQEKLNDTRKV